MSLFSFESVTLQISSLKKLYLKILLPESQRSVFFLKFLRKLILNICSMWIVVTKTIVSMNILPVVNGSHLRGNVRARKLSLIFDHILDEKNWSDLSN